MADLTPLNIADAENAYKALLQLVMNYPNYPTGFVADNNSVKWSLLERNNSIGIFPLQGAVYVKKYVSGSYVAQLPFQIAYKCSPTTNKLSIDAQDMLEQMAKWIETCNIAYQDTKLTTEYITRETPVYIERVNEREHVYMVNFQMRYSYKK